MKKQFNIEALCLHMGRGEIVVKETVWAENAGLAEMDFRHKHMMIEIFKVEEVKKKVRTTSKVFRSLVRVHIMSILSNEYGDTIEERLSALMHEFRNWYDEVNRKMYPTKQDAFIQFLQCIPSPIGGIAFSYFEFYTHLKLWFETAGGTYEEKSSDLESRLYYNLVTREIRELCKIHSLEF